MSAELGLVLDCADPEKLAEFWASALGYVNLGTAGSYVALDRLLKRNLPDLGWKAVFAATE